MMSFLIISNGKFVFAQDTPLTFFQPAKEFNKKRFIAVCTGEAVTISATFIGLYYLWYRGYDQSSFHFFDDSEEWMQHDKIGHAQTSYSIAANLLIPLHEWTGVKHKKAVLIGGGIAFIFQSTIEVLDGFSAKWGASWSDIIANTSGLGLAVGQEFLWKEQRIWFKVSSHYANYSSYDADEQRRINNLYGSSFQERFFKDYNASTYWLSGNISSFLPGNNKFPKWLNVAVGYGTQGMLGGYENVWMEGDTTYVRTNIPRYRQFYFSFDVDFTRLPFKKQGWKTIARFLNVIKIPFPALEYNKIDGLKFHPLYF